MRIAIFCHVESAFNDSVDGMDNSDGRLLLLSHFPTSPWMMRVIKPYARQFDGLRVHIPTDSLIQEAPFPMLSSRRFDKEAGDFWEREKRPNVLADLGVLTPLIRCAIQGDPFTSRALTFNAPIAVGVVGAGSAVTGVNTTGLNDDRLLPP